MSKITLARYRNSDYIVRCEIDGVEKRYTWKGSRGNVVDRKTVPTDVVEWLNLNTECFNKGALVVEGKDKDVEALKEDFEDVDNYDNNTHTYEEIKKILTGHHMTMQKKLKDITVEDEKRFVVDVAKEIQDDLAGGKQKFIAEWYGSETDILFD